MNNGIDKKALFTLKTEPYLKPISDLGIGFYNLDENTAKLIFQLKNSKGPLSISKNHATAYASFESENGSAAHNIELDILDENKGIVSITVPKDFLQASTNTKVIGQVYIGVNNVPNKPEYNEVAVFGEFSFEVKDALINKISSFTKIEYIRMFDQLKEQIQKRVRDIEKAIENGEDYVAEMKSILQKGIDEINELAALKKSEILKAIEDKQIVSKPQLDKTLEDLSWQKSKLTTNGGVMDNFSGLDFDNPESVLGNKTVFGYVGTSSNHPNVIPAVSSTGFFKYFVRTQNYKKIEYRPFNSNRVFERTKHAGTWKEWSEVFTDESILNVQNHKLTEDDGTRIEVSLKNNKELLHNLSPGDYYATSVPITSSSSSAGFLSVMERKNSVTHITFSPYNSPEIWFKRYYNEWTDWELLNPSIDDYDIQKYKLTQDDGSRIYLREINYDISTLDTGQYLITYASNVDWNIVNNPDTPYTRTGHIAMLDVTKDHTGRKQFVYWQSHKNQVFVATTHTDGVLRDWKEITYTQEDTGWVPLNLINGAVPYSDSSLPYYRFTNNNGDRTIKIKATIKGISETNTVVATLPNYISEHIDQTLAFVQNCSLYSGDATVARWTIQTNGDIKLENVSFPTSDMKEGNWYPMTITLPV